MNKSVFQIVALALVCLVSVVVSGPMTCAMSDIEWSTAGSTSTAFCCGSYPEYSQTATVTYSLTVNDNADIYYTSDCSEALDGFCIDCCKDSNCEYVASCDNGADCTGAFVVSAEDCDLNTLSIVLRCQAGLFDDCEYTWNTLTITLDNAGSTDNTCCDCDGLTNATFTY
mmetsp:Transcript_12949/g.51675  ORF Transcript_12949/g.51675 Transcript_12949/m.51675 type:complete len:170 (+) Transcript_12949:49-558(+)